MKTTTAVFQGTEVPELPLGRSDAIGAAEKQPEFHDVRRIGDGVGCAFFDGAEKEAAVFGIAENKHRRMGRLGIDVIQKTQSDLFGLLGRMAQVEQDYVGPSKEFLQLIHAAAAICAQCEAFS